MKKRLYALVLACCMMLGITACGQGEGVGVDGNNVSLQGRLNDSQVYYATDLKLNIQSPASDVDFKVYGTGIYYRRDKQS